MKNTEILTKCLESLMTIKEQISTEIVVVDTGCDSE